MKKKIFLPLVLLVLNFSFILANNSYATTANNEQTTNFSAVLAPKNLKVHYKNHETIMLSFENYNSSENVQEFEIYQDGKLAFTTRYRRYNLRLRPALNYTVTGLTPATSYEFKIRAKDVSGNYSRFSKVLKVSTLEEDTEAPTAPANLSFRHQRRNDGTLYWDFSTDNVEVASYEVYLNGNKVGTTPSYSNSFLLSYLQENTEYKMSVRAIDWNENVSEFSEITVTLKSPTVPVTPPSTQNPNSPVDPSNITLNVYPNPADDVLNVDFTANGTTKYSIYDASKKPIRVQNYLTRQIDVSNLSPGLYYLVVNNNFENYEKTFIKR